MVIKYAQAEKNNLGSLKTIERLESKLKDAAKEKDGHLGKIKDLKIEKARLGHELDLKVSITDEFFFYVKNLFLVA